MEPGIVALLGSFSILLYVVVFVLVLTTPLWAFVFRNLRQTSGC